MFLYLASTANLSVSPYAVPQFLPGKIRVIRNHDAALVWIEDKFTRTREGTRQVVIEVLRPSIDRQPIVRLSWSLSSGAVTLERRWSGEFSAYIARRPIWMLASHLKLIAWVSCGMPPGVTALGPGRRLQIAYGQITEEGIEAGKRAMTKGLRFNYDETVARVRNLVHQSVRGSTGSSALLLSGGVDSSVIAAAGKSAGKNLFAFVFGLKCLIRPQRRSEDDFLHARKVAKHLGLALEEIRLEPRRLIANVPAAIALSETPRGTIVDDCVALIEVARILSKRGYSTVWTGEGADDLFGGFKFALRYYKGWRLKKYYRHELGVSLPNELSILQKVFEPWGISVVHPFWIRELKSLCERLPLAFRIDSKRLMKRILRDAFRDRLPTDICERPKGVTRDTTQIRFVLESRFGTSRERYRPEFHKIFRDGFTWPEKRIT